MTEARRWTRAAGLAGLALLFFPPVAAAYIDPGSVSLALQGIIAFLLGGAFVVKTYWRQLVDKVRGLFSTRQHD